MSTGGSVGIAEIRAAAQRLAPVVRRTPLLESPFLNALAGRRVLVKAECLQRTGSFKFRGGWSAVSALPEAARRRGVIAYSSGNHAQGVAHAAELHGIPCVIVMPSNAPALKLENTRAHGAEVVLYDREAGEDREAIGARIAAERGLSVIRPYDDPMVIAGQGTAGLEIAEQAREAGVTEADLVVCTGGGGLAAGIALACEAEAPGLRLRTAEPDGFDDWRRSLAAGRREANAAETGSVCDAILSREPGELTWPIVRPRAGPGLAVSDEEALKAVKLAMLRLKIVLEPGGAVSLAACLFRGSEIGGDAVICVATGANADPAMLARALAMP